MSESSPSNPTVFHSLSWLLRYAIRRWSSVIVVMLAILLRVGLDLLKPWPMKVLVDHVLRDGPPSRVVQYLINHLPRTATDEQQVMWCVAATVVIFVLGWAITAISATANIGLGQRLAYDVAADVFSHLQRLSLRFHARKSVGDSIRRVLTDSTAVSTIVKDAILPAVGALYTLVAMFFVLWQLSWPLTLIALAIVPFQIFVLRRYTRPMLEISYAQQEAEGRMYGVVEQTLSSMPVIQAFTREAEADQRVRLATEDSLNAALAVTRIQIKFKFLVGLATAVGTAGILWLGASRALREPLSVGTILVFLSYLASLYAPLESLAYTSSTVQYALGSARRVREILDQTPEVRESPAAVALPTARGEVRLDNVSFGYDPDRPVLHDINLEAQPGQLVAIVGPTGAGKSTLLSLIPRFFDPWNGVVSIDGQPISSLKLGDLRRNISIVLQEPFLFPLSIAENIAYGRPDAMEGEILAAAVAACADEFIRQLPQGYDTVIGERGATLSGGQRQRISIARALLKSSPILLLDEPTSALDAATEQLLVSALAQLMQNKTTFVIAHRLSTIRKADMILVLDQGRIVERGTHDQLVNSGLLYQRLYQSFTGES